MRLTNGFRPISAMRVAYSRTHGGAGDSSHSDGDHTASPGGVRDWIAGDTAAKSDRAIAVAGVQRSCRHPQPAVIAADSLRIDRWWKRVGRPASLPGPSAWRGPRGVEPRVVFEPIGLAWDVQHQCRVATRNARRDHHRIRLGG